MKFELRNKSFGFLSSKKPNIKLQNKIIGIIHFYYATSIFIINNLHNQTIPTFNK